MTPKEKAQELIKKFKNHVNPYIGSGMLSNTHDDGAILRQSKFCAEITVDEVIKQWEYIDTHIADLGGELNPNLRYWQEVREEILNLEKC